MPTSTILCVKKGTINCNKLPANSPIISWITNFLYLKRYLDINSNLIAFPSTKVSL